MHVTLQHVAHSQQPPNYAKEGKVHELSGEVSGTMLVNLVRLGYPMGHGEGSTQWVCELSSELLAQKHLVASGLMTF